MADVLNITLNEISVDELIPVLEAERGRLYQIKIEDPDIAYSPYEEYGWVNTRIKILETLLYKMKEWQEKRLKFQV